MVSLSDGEEAKVDPDGSLQFPPGQARVKGEGAQQFMYKVPGSERDAKFDPAARRFL